MFRKTIEYTDYNGNKRKEDFYFNLTKAELAMLEMSESGGITQKIDRLTQTQDSVEIAKLFQEIIRKSYGQKSPDGRRFIKSKELADEFEQTEAYSELVIWLFNAENAAEFIKGTLPADLAEAVNKNAIAPIS